MKRCRGPLHAEGGENLPEAYFSKSCSRCKACRKLDWEKSKARFRGPLAGWSPEHDMTKTVPEGFTVKGVSTLYDDEGKVRAQWVKSRQEDGAFQAFLDGVAAGLKEEIKPQRAVPVPKLGQIDLAAVYLITDYHLGMLAWDEESGANWDLKIAEDLLVRWFAAAIQAAPAADTAVFAQLGDFLHFDGMRAVTPVSGHNLDADSRFTKIVRVAIRAVRRIIQMLLEKHRRVIVLMEEGNHDEASSVWLRELFAALYSDEPRVEVDTRPDPYHLFLWGSCFVGFHHGHKRKPQEIAPILVAKFREEYGSTTFHVAHMGHMHHDLVIEGPLMRVEQHRTIAARDAYASRNGYYAGRDAKLIVYHKQHGEVARTTISLSMLGDSR